MFSSSPPHFSRAPRNRVIVVLTLHTQVLDTLPQLALTAPKSAVAKLGGVLALETGQAADEKTKIDISKSIH